MFDSIVDALTDSGWAYVIVFALALGDVLFPVLPSETAVITAGVLAGAGDLELLPIIGLAALGAVCGDNIAYFLGNRLTGPVERRLFKGDRRRHLERAERALAERGGSFIIIGRFIPGGRTAVAFGAGILHYRWRRYIGFDVAAGLLWASYAALIGYFGGRAFEDEPWKGILVAFAIAFGIAAASEGVRWLLRRRRSGRRGGGGGRPSAGPTPRPVAGDSGDRG